jgi:tRNA(fMet)-specific endonuclease VapC
VTYLLDTNACIQYLNRRSTGIERQLLARKPSDVNVCSIVKAELYVEGLTWEDWEAGP